MALAKILVVDDDTNLLELVKMRLESAGYEVSAMLEAADAIAAIKTQPFDLCLLDLMLGRVDGTVTRYEATAPWSGSGGASTS